MQVIQEFGEKEGFQYIARRVNAAIHEKQNLNVEHLFAFIDLIVASHNLYHRAFISETISKFVEGAMEYMSAIPEEQLKNVKREKLDLALNQMDSLMRRVFTAKTRGERSIKLKVGVAISLLRSEQLERRIQAIRLIAETCKSAKASQVFVYQSQLPTANDNAVLSSLLQVPLVINEIFGKRSHIQLIQRSTEILKFFLQNSDIKSEDFNVIWKCCENDEQSKVEIFKVISDSTSLLPSELIGFVIEKYTGKEVVIFKDNDAELVCEFGGRLAKPTITVMKDILKVMWNVITGGFPGISNETVAKTLERFCDAITTPSRVPEQYMREYFEQAYKMLESVLLIIFI